MAKKKEKKICRFERVPWLRGTSCPHDYFATYVDPETGENIDCCIFHAPMELKKDRINEFWKAFDKLYDVTTTDFRREQEEEKKKGIKLDCTSFVFPDTGVTFRDKEFPFNVNFAGAVFSGKAGFEKVTFNGGADFNDATFLADTDFYYASFSGVAEFPCVTFARGVIFREAFFGSGAKFGGATFAGDVSFSQATFDNEVSFCGTTFEQRVDFLETEFEQGANFEWASFRREAIFVAAIFISEITYNRVIFEGKTTFKNAFLPGRLKLTESQFLEDADFRGISLYIVDDAGKRKGPGAVLFDNAFFHQPERVQVGGEETDLGQWSFKDTNIEKVNFVNEKWKRKARWRKKYTETPQKLKFWPFRSIGRKVIFDEVLAAEDEKKEYKRVTWEDAGQVYRRLRVKFEGELAYELTSDFHYGQMECRRLNSDRPLLHPDRVVAFLYKIVSGYGERFLSPLIWLIGSFVVFTGAFMFLGFKPAGESEVIWRFCSPGEMFADGFWSWVLDLGKAVTFTMRAAVSFRLEGITKDPVIFLAHLWKLFALVFATFFILALRRRFKK